MASISLWVINRPYRAWSGSSE